MTLMEKINGTAYSIYIVLVFQTLHMVNNNATAASVELWEGHMTSHMTGMLDVVVV